MGNYINPGSYGFEEIRNGTYVDKTGLVGLVNSVIRTPQKRWPFGDPCTG